MSCCGNCRAIDAKFGSKAAEADRRRYRRRGPDKTTSQMLAMIRGMGLSDVLLLDVGGGIGVLDHELLRREARSAVLVEASTAYLMAARDEADALGNGDRLRTVPGDFVTVAPELDPADVVTLDRVVCCYLDYHTLLEAAADRSRRALSISYPQDRWYVRLMVALQNLGRRLMRDPFRAYVHPQDGMHHLLTESGLRLGRVTDGFVWRVALYLRRSDGGPSGVTPLKDQPPDGGR